MGDEGPSLCDQDPAESNTEGSESSWGLDRGALEARSGGNADAKEPLAPPTSGRAARQGSSLREAGEETLKVAGRTTLAAQSWGIW